MLIWARVQQLRFGSQKTSGHDKAKSHGSAVSRSAAHVRPVCAMIRRLGIDPGRKRIGLSLSDETGSIALPHSIVETRGDGDEATETIANLVHSTGALEIVIGLPLRLDGSEGDAVRRARGFATRLERRVDVPIVFWDERMTTALAERTLRELGHRSRKLRGALDASAATLILQSYIDARIPRPCQIEDPAADPRPASAARRNGRSGGRRKKR